MKQIILLLLLLTVTHVCAAGGPELSDDECAQIYVSVEDSGGKVTEAQASKFLNAISCGYFSTAEGGEFGAELIMIVLENSPAEFVLSFDKLSEPLRKVIIGEIGSPIHDGFDLNNIYHVVYRVKAKSQGKARILEAVKAAAKEQNAEIK